MAYDVGEWTPRILEEGLPSLPRRLEPDQTIPIALWRGKRYGAVLFVRLWKNGNVDSDCAISARAPDDSWDPPGSWGGAGWLEDPLLRSATGWDGEPVAWIGSSSHDDVRAVLGAPSHRVGAIAVEQRGHGVDRCQSSPPAARSSSAWRSLPPRRSGSSTATAADSPARMASPS